MARDGLGSPIEPPPDGTLSVELCGGVRVKERWLAGMVRSLDAPEVKVAADAVKDRSSYGSDLRGSEIDHRVT